MSSNIIEQKQRVRSANFSDPEEELLVRLVLNRKDVIECKVTDTQRNDNKTSAWDDITFHGGGPDTSEWRPKSEEHAALRDAIALSIDGLRAICDDDDDYDVNAIVFPKMSAISDNVNQVTTDNEHEVEYLEETEVILSGNNNVLDQEVTGVAAATSQSIDAAQKWKVEMWEQYNPAMLKRAKTSALKTHKNNF